RVFWSMLSLVFVGVFIVWFFFFFFFQAEDGIRDLIVTGVQTCALPICAILTIRSAGFAASPVGFSQIAFGLWNSHTTGLGRTLRSEERRVGKECRTRWSRWQ